MIHLTSSQIVVACLYIIVFALILSLFVHITNDHVTKQSRDYWIYFSGVIILLVIFLAFGNAILGLAAHLKASGFVLVTLKFNTQQKKYLNHGADKITDDEAAMLAAYFDTHTPVDGFYEYNLIDDKNNTRRFNCMKPDLLGFLNASHRPEPPISIEDEIKAAEEPADNNNNNDQQQDNE